MRSICNLHNGIVLRTPSLLSLAIIWSNCVPRNRPTVQFGATKTQSFTHFKLAIMLKLIEFKFIRPYTYLWARKTTVRWPTQQRYPQVVVYKALCDVLRKALEKKAKFYKKKKQRKEKEREKKGVMFLILQWLWSTLTTTTVIVILHYRTKSSFCGMSWKFECCSFLLIDNP